jgi:hypothetical protein
MAAHPLDRKHFGFAWLSGYNYAFLRGPSGGWRALSVRVASVRRIA